MHPRKKKNGEKSETPKEQRLTIYVLEPKPETSTTNVKGTPPSKLKWHTMASPSKEGESSESFRHQIRPPPPTTTGKSENKMANNKLQRKSEKEVAKKSHPHSLVETTKKALGRETKNASFWEMQLEKAALEMTVKVSQKQRVHLWRR